MNMNKAEANALFNELNTAAFSEKVEVMIFPPSIYLSEFADNSQGKIKIWIQNSYDKSNGAFTGEISAEMLQSIGVNLALVGHSERREYFKEKDELLSQKVNALLKNNITPVFCFGEKLEERESKNHFKVIQSQIENGVFHLKDEQFSQLILAYEPVWAIGTGVTASSEQAQEMHSFIRGVVKKKYGENIAENVQILYGGSCKPSNAEELFSCPDVDGGLIGGASLKAEDFSKLIEIAGSI